MAVSLKKNPIERRLEQINTLWDEFIENSDARLLRWFGKQDSLRMVDVFLKVENEEIGHTKDLFINLDNAFENQKEYGFDLIELIKKEYKRSLNHLEEENIPSDWLCPALNPKLSDIENFINCCVSFKDFYKEMLSHFVIVFLPQKISNKSDFQTWLLTLANSDIPDTVRFMVVDYAELPVLESAELAENKKIITQELDLDMPAAYMELAHQVGDTPDCKFRNCFLALSIAAGKGDIKCAAKEAKAALAIAEKHNWITMQTTVYMALASAYLAAGKTDEAIVNYQHAEKTTVKDHEEGDTTASKLMLQAKFGHAGVLLSEKQFTEAADVYKEVVPLAQQLEDNMMTIEACRMASYCYEKENEIDLAWEYGDKALDAGDILKQQDRKNTTLAFVGQAMLGLTEHHPYDQQFETLDKRIENSLGVNWKKLLNQT